MIILLYTTYLVRKKASPLIGSERRRISPISVENCLNSIMVIIMPRSTQIQLLESPFAIRRQSAIEQSSIKTFGNESESDQKLIYWIISCNYNQAHQQTNVE